MEYMHDEVGYNYRLVNVFCNWCVTNGRISILLEIKKKMDQFTVLSFLSWQIEFQHVSLSDVEANCWLFTF
jgi:hypothetical protein